MAATQVQYGVTNNRINREPIDSETVIYSYADLEEKVNAKSGFIYGGLVTSVVNDPESEKRGPYYISYNKSVLNSYSCDRIPLKGEIDPIMYGGMCQPIYTKPQIYGVFKSAYNGEYLNPTLSNIFEEVEIGTLFTPEIVAHWPLSTECSYGTRQDLQYANNQASGELTPAPGSYVLGYSYGVNGHLPVNISDYNGTKYDGDINLPIQCSQIYLDKEGSYTICNLNSVSYLNSSYSFYPELYKNGIKKYAYGVGDSTWFAAGDYISSAKYTVDIHYKYYYGLSDTIPETKEELEAGMSGFLNNSSILTGTTTNMIVGKPGYKKMCFWISYPNNFGLVSYNIDYRILITQSDGVIFDLMSGWQKMNRKLININIGNSSMTHDYYVAYCEFEAPLGNPSSVISFKIVPQEAISYYLITTENEVNTIITENDKNNMIFDSLNGIIIDDIFN